MKEPLPYQVDTDNKIGMSHHVALFWEMRLGKSVLCIRWLLRIPARSILIVTQATASIGWIDELHDAEQYNVFWYTGPQKKRLDLFTQFCRVTAGKRYLIISHEMLRREKLAEHFDAIVIDESSKIKNPSARITKHLLRHYAAIPYRAILSGTPNPEHDMEFCTQFLFLLGNFCGCTNYYTARKLLCYQPYRAMPWRWDIRPASKTRLHNFLFTNAFFLLRKDVNVGSHIMREFFTVAPSRLQLKLQREIEDTYALPADTERGLPVYETQWATVVASVLSRIAGGFRPEHNGTLISDRKIQATLDVVHDVFRGETHCVLWFRYRAELMHFVQMFATIANTPNYYVITGSTSKTVRREQLQRWRAVGGLLIATVACAKYGVDCSQADTAIYYSRSYDGETNLQSEARTISPLKTTPILIVDMITEGTIDEDVKTAIRNKRVNMKTLFKAYQQRKHL